MRPDYGIDGPRFLRNLIAWGGGLFLVSFLVNGDLRAWMACAGAFAWVVAGVRLWANRVRKLAMREPLVESLRLTGAERVLDIGCGRGYLLIAIAKRLPKGRSVGVDDWSDVSREDTLYNARAERVEERIELHTGILSDLPFGDAEFDVVVSAWRIQRLPPADRDRALREAVRVLKPGGMLLIVDGCAPFRYQEALRLAGMVDVFLSGPNFTFVTPSWRITARKPP